MSDFKLINSNIFKMPNSKNLLHIATITSNLREFVVMLKPKTGDIYLEEIVLNQIDFSNDVYANLKYINDDILFKELSCFVKENNLIDIARIANILIDGGNIHLLTI